MKVRSKTPQKFFNEINPVVRLLIFSDILVIGASGMLAPLFALFVEDFIVGGDALVASVAIGVYLISRSLVQIPIATLIDKLQGEMDDFWTMVIFTFMSGVFTLAYLVIDQPWQLYLIQMLLGVATAMTYPSYMAIFTRHIDKDKEGTEWGIYYTLTDLGSAVLAIVGGYMATEFGFYSLIGAVGVITMAGGLILIPIKNYLALTLEPSSSS